MDLDKTSGQKASQTGHVVPFSWFWEFFLAGVFLDVDRVSISKNTPAKKVSQNHENGKTWPVWDAFWPDVETTPIKAYSMPIANLCLIVH